jgi:hypothetical protein
MIILTWLGLIDRSISKQKWSKKYKSLKIIGLDCLQHQASLIFGWSGPVRLQTSMTNFDSKLLNCFFKNSVFKTTKMFTIEVSNRQYVHRQTRL